MDIVLNEKESLRIQNESGVLSKVFADIESLGYCGQKTFIPKLTNYTVVSVGKLGVRIYQFKNESAFLEWSEDNKIQGDNILVINGQRKVNQFPLKPTQ